MGTGLAHTYSYKHYGTYTHTHTYSYMIVNLKVHVETIQPPGFQRETPPKFFPEFAKI